jgi:transcriptional regulator with GAF, ATPase, and Fis domain
LDSKSSPPQPLIGLQREQSEVEPPLTAGTSRPDRFALLYDLGCAFAARIELEELIPLVVAKCREVLNAEGISVMLLDQEHSQLYFPYVSQADPQIKERLANLRFAAELGVAGAALKSGQSIRVMDAQHDPRLYHGVDLVTGITTHDLLAVPLITHQGTIGVIEAVNSRGAQPFSEDDLAFLEALAGSIAVALENARLYAQVRESEASLRTRVGVLRRDLARTDVFSKIIGATPPMHEVFRLMESAAASSIPVLIEGETGTGKELVARGIHMASVRGEGPFVAINCVSLPETLLESELFGHRRGAFTGAVRDNPGLFRAASGGVIFLDEISDMPMSMQAKLLRVLEEEEVVAVGDTFPRKVDVRVLSATNRDLKTAVENGTFRQDLYYRVAVFPIKLPPLRQRREDIVLLANHFLNLAMEQNHRRIDGFDPEVLDILTRSDWPGNVRQLRNEIDRAVALARDGEMLRPSHFSAILQELGRPAAPAPAVPEISVEPVTRAVAVERQERRGSGAAPLREAKAAFEKGHIAEALTLHNGNVSRTAQALGLSRAALQKKMKIYELR